MKKPVIYTQFDKNNLYSTHYYKEGDFSYERDGFGEVLYDYEDSVKAILSYIEKGGGMEDKYKKRVDEFFVKRDHNNSKRVYEAIRACDKE
jgi:CDP-glycerol glycerophosphotransferase (TagB/SpsB family)